MLGLEGTGQQEQLEDRPYRWAAKCDGTMLSLAYSPDGREVATGDEAKQLTVWDRATCEKVRFLKESGPSGRR